MSQQQNRQPFVQPVKTNRRTINVQAAVDPNLRLPTPDQMKPQRIVQANPPVPQMYASTQEPQPIPSAPLPDKVRALTNTPDLTVFDESFITETGPDNNVEMRVTDTPPEGSFWERIALPSRDVLYDLNVHVRPFTAPDLALIYKARKNRDTILLYDTLAKTVNVDIRKMWTVDVRWIMYWHRWNSYIKTPYQASWQSIYGNANKTKISLSDVKVTPLSMTKQEYSKWLLKGFKVPDIRDAEHFETFKATLTEDQYWLYERAMYLQGEGLHDQVKKLQGDNSIEILYQIKEFMDALSDSGIYETTTAKDQYFVYEDAVKKLAADLEVLNNALATDLNLDEKTEELFYKRRDTIATELARLVSNPGEAEPMLETINLKLGVLDFFPDIF